MTQEKLYIFGFLNPLQSTSAPITILLTDDAQSLKAVYPAYPSISDLDELCDDDGEDLTTEGARALSSFIPAKTPSDALDVWQEGQLAYLDYQGEPRVGFWKDLFKVVEADIDHVTDEYHRNRLFKILKDHPLKD